MPLLRTEAPGLEHIDSWINSAPINLEDGNYLLYFWNYSCSCCRERLKLFRRINQEYSDINVVGVHTPQYGFEKNERNLEKAVEKLDISHPVAHDRGGRASKEYGMAYSNHAIIIEEGSIVFQQTPEMDAAELRQKISEMLGDEKEVELPEQNQDRSSQEFFGHSRTAGLNEEGNYPGEKNYRLPENRKKDQTYLKGTWEQKKHFIEAKSGSELRYSFESSKAGLVVDPNGGIRDIKVLINDESVSEDEAGEDLRVENGESYIRAKHPDLYELFDGEHRVHEITLIPDKRTRFYALSFR